MADAAEGLDPIMILLFMPMLIVSLTKSVLASPLRNINAVSDLSCSLNWRFAPSHVSILNPFISFLRVFQRKTRFLKMLLRAAFP